MYTHKIYFEKKIKIEIDNVGTTFVLVFLESRQGRSTISRRGFLAPRQACAFDRWTYVRVNTDPANAIYSRNWIKPSEKVPLLSKAFGINMRPIRLRCPLEEILWIRITPFFFSFFFLEQRRNWTSKQSLSYLVCIYVNMYLVNFLQFFFVFVLTDKTDKKKEEIRSVKKCQKYLADRSIPFKIPNLTAKR